jgi:hypothetical protein
VDKLHRYHLYKPNVIEIPSTANDGYVYVEEPFADFFWMPANPRAGETITYDGTLSHAYGVAIGDFDQDG